MALTTASNRFSMMSHIQGVSTALVVPSGTVTDGDKQTYLNMYGGILWATLVAATGGQTANSYWWWE